MSTTLLGTKLYIPPLLLAQNQPREAQSLLQELARIVESEGRVARLITIYVLQALAEHALISALSCGSVISLHS